MLSRRLQTLGVALLLLGLAAHTFGWDMLWWVPQTAAEALHAFLAALSANPLTYGLIAAGLALIVLARLIRR